MKTAAILSLFAPLALSACAAPNAKESPRIGLANPASVYCNDQGGRTEIRSSEAGQSGYCHLPDGRVIEEWELYRAAHKS